MNIDPKTEKRIAHLSTRMETSQALPLSGRFKPRLLAPVFEEIAGQSSERKLIQRLSIPNPPTDVVELSVCAALLDRELYLARLQSELQILKKIRGATHQSSVFAADGMRKIFPDARYLRTLVLSDQTAKIVLANVFDLAKLSEHAEEAGFNVRAGKDSLGRKTLSLVGSDPASEITLSAISALFEHDSFGRSAELFDQSLTDFIEFICLLAYRPDWIIGSSLVHLGNYEPILQLAFPGQFNDCLGNAIQAVQEASLSNPGQILHETWASRREAEGGRRKSDDQTLALNKEYIPFHVAYVTVRPKMGRFSVKFDCDIDMLKLESYLADLGYKTVTGQTHSSRKVAVNLGSRFDQRQYFDMTTSTKILDGSEKEVMNIVDDNTVFFNLANIGDAIKLMNLIYSKILFVTPNIRNEEHGSSGLSQVEREVINSIDRLVRFYSFFLEMEDIRERIQLGPYEGSSPLQWVGQKMMEGKGDFSARVLHVLKILDERVDPANFGSLGGEKETQENARELYRQLKHLITQFQAIVPGS